MKHLGVIIQIKATEQYLHMVLFVFGRLLFIFSSIYFFYKPFKLYYKIEELKMLFVELNIRLQE